MQEVTNLKVIEIAERLKAQGSEPVLTVACQSCRKPLWAIQIKGRYGTRTVATKTSYPGVPDWRTYWSRDQKTPKKVDCPFCMQDYMSGIQGPNGTLFPKMLVLELEGV